MAEAAGIKAKGPKAELVNALTALDNGNGVEIIEETKEKPKGASTKATKKRKNPVTDVEDNGNEGENEDKTIKQSKRAKSNPTKKGKSPVTDDEDNMFLLISSTGPATDHMCETFGLYRKTKEMKEGRHVFAVDLASD